MTKAVRSECLQIVRRRLVGRALILSMILPLACATTSRQTTPPSPAGAGVGGQPAQGAPTPATTQTNAIPTSGVITGNGSGGVPDRVAVDLPLKDSVTAFVDKLATAEPTYARLIRNFIFSHDVSTPTIQFYKTKPKDGAAPSPNHDGEQCLLNGAEVRAYFDPVAFNITFCRGFSWTKESGFRTAAAPDFQVMVVMHEFMHVLFKVTKTVYGATEEEIVSSFDSFLLNMIQAGDPAAFKTAVLAFRDQLDRSMEQLGVWSLPDEVVGAYDKVPVLANNTTILYPVPKALYTSGYIAPHFLELQLANIWTTQMIDSVAGLLAANGADGTPLLGSGDLGNAKNLSFYQTLVRETAAGLDAQVAKVSLATIFATFDYTPGSTLNGRTLTAAVLSPDLQNYLQRAADPDMSVSWIRAVQYRPTDGTANGANDYLIFVQN